MKSMQTASLDCAFVLRIARLIKESVAQVLHQDRWRQPAQVAHSGDTSFQLDLRAEEALDEFLSSQRAPVALYTEDRGLVRYGQGDPRGLLVVDPIDGTRPALAGLECACVSVALAHYSPQPRLKDVFAGCLLELRRPTTFLAQRGQGVVISHLPGLKKPRLSSTSAPERVFWSFELVGRPPVETISVLEPLIMASGLEAGMFLLSSATYSISRILLGRLDAYVDIGARLLSGVPGTREKFLQAGKGRVVCLFPYDIAAAVLVAREAGCTVTDAAGRSLDDLPLIQRPGDSPPSCLVTSNERLHRQLLEIIDRGFLELVKERETGRSEGSKETIKRRRIGTTGRPAGRRG
jgi:myo-inositol-1(or 4)-monophosphatase